MTQDNTNTIDPESGIDSQEEDTLPSVADTVDTSIDVKDPSLGYDLETPATEDAVMDKIADQLGASSKPVDVAESEVATPVNNLPFDLTKLSVEQIQQLQQMLSTTPESVKKRIIKPVTQIRTIDGKFLVDAKKSYMKLKKNTLEGRDEIAHYISVRFFGSDKFEEYEYRDILNAERVKCPIVSTRTVDNSYVEGEPVEHRETGRLTEREVKILTPYYTIQLPNGETTEIKGEMSNF